MANYTSSYTGLQIDAAVATGVADSGLTGSGGNAEFTGNLDLTERPR